MQAVIAAADLFLCMGKAPIGVIVSCWPSPQGAKMSVLNRAYKRYKLPQWKRQEAFDNLYWGLMVAILVFFDRLPPKNSR